MEVLIELMACDVEVRVRAWVISCLSFAFKIKYLGLERSYRTELKRTRLKSKHHERGNCTGWGIEVVLCRNQVHTIRYVLESGGMCNGCEMKWQTASSRTYYGLISIRQKT